MNAMIELLEVKLPDILKSIRQDTWDSLIINRRKPHTYRAFRQFGDERVCLHRFEPCEKEDAFAHPHPWPGAFLMLQGEYVQSIGYSHDLASPPVFIYKELIRPGTIYEIVHRQTWHTVQPLTTCYTVMLNGKPWEGAHAEVRTTKGKDLDKMSEIDLLTHLVNFDRMLDYYLWKLRSNEIYTMTNEF